MILLKDLAKKRIDDPVNAENRIGSYRALEQLYKEGKVKQIGISNFTAKHLTELLQVCDVIPHLHQFELHPCLYQPEILEICKKNQIQVQAYSSLGEGKLLNGEIRLDCLEKISERHKVSPAVILLGWALKHGWIIIPKSKTPERVKENASSLSINLTDEDMKSLDDVHKTESHRFCWDPNTIY
ncbi:hypothetical protein G6F56_012035 [Rhizopus delemar]|nr:hypothetical protein G6F56_012035 [Rhizopus delemar]